MPLNQDDRFWDLVFKRIEEEKCILIIGPDIATSDPNKSLNELLKESLQQNQSNEIEY